MVHGVVPGPTLEATAVVNLSRTLLLLKCLL